MNIGDEIINVPGRLTVFYEGNERYSIYSYNEKGSKGFQVFTGTVDELFLHLGKQVKAHNEHVDKFGTRYAGEKIV
jgi:hypothetical protein